MLSLSHMLLLIVAIATLTLAAPPLKTSVSRHTPNSKTSISGMNKVKARDDDKSLCCFGSCLVCTEDTPCSSGQVNCRLRWPYSTCCAVEFVASNNPAHAGSSDGYFVNAAGNTVTLVSPNTWDGVDPAV
ncbi:hypothetical protein B0T16DRAFT_455476 [Cercophora newfieldiana]|uniref:Uncharacterized protein n=1 Tax=Cercophora newfieldiana TaxID=92897 RepID=A0AA40CWF9_9PEZI|nr:hypothetical protein B0T16DRAFT_455476 [Cercophora newfieldiana]